MPGSPAITAKWTARNVSGALLFSASGSAGSEPWRTDGTAKGTRKIADVLVLERADEGGES